MIFDEFSLSFSVLLIEKFESSDGLNSNIYKNTCTKSTCLFLFCSWNCIQNMSIEQEKFKCQYRAMTKCANLIFCLVERDCIVLTSKTLNLHRFESELLVGKLYQTYMKFRLEMKWYMVLVYGVRWQWKFKLVVVVLVRYI